MITLRPTQFSVFRVYVVRMPQFLFLGNSAAQVKDEPAGPNYTFETIDVPGVELLAVTASSDFEGLRWLHAEC